MLVEITSALGNTDPLRVPICNNKTGKVVYEGGKFEKCEDQLYQSLRDLKLVSTIASKLDAYQQRICMMAYVINPYTDPIYYEESLFCDTSTLKQEQQQTKGPYCLLPR